MWPTLILYLFIQSITPGPNNLTCIYLGATCGFKKTQRFLTSSMLSLLAKALLCGLLNMMLAEFVPTLVKYLKWVGAAYMIYLAYKMAISGWKEETQMTGQQSESTIKGGIILQLLNVKSWLCCISMYAVYVISNTTDTITIILVAACFTTLAWLCALLWATCGTILKSFISKYKKPFGIVMGLSLLYCAVNALL